MQTRERHKPWNRGNRPLSSSSPPAPSPIPVLGYHTISDHPEPGIASFAVRPDDLARHLDLIVAGGHTAMTASALADLLGRNIEPPPGAVVITFDDGFEDNLSVAAPMLSARALPATVYVTTGYLAGWPAGTVASVPGTMIGWSSLVDLEAAGIEVGAHAHTHRPLDALSRSEASGEIRRSKDLLEAALGHRVTSFAYPHGYGSPRVQDEVRRCGFHSAYGVRNAFSHSHDNPWLRARLTVRATTTPDTVERWLAGSGAALAVPGEQPKTTVWRYARRAAHLASNIPGPARAGAHL